MAHLSTEKMRAERELLRVLTPVGTKSDDRWSILPQRPTRIASEIRHVRRKAETPNLLLNYGIPLLGDLPSIERGVGKFNLRSHVVNCYKSTRYDLTAFHWIELASQLHLAMTWPFARYIKYCIMSYIILHFLHSLWSMWSSCCECLKN